MHKFSVYTVATIALAAVFASAPARADFNYGMAKNGNQCWKASPDWTGSSGGMYGYWSDCPAPAAAVAAAPKRTHHRRATHS